VREHDKGDGICYRCGNIDEGAQSQRQQGLSKHPPLPRDDHILDRNTSARHNEHDGKMSVRLVIVGVVVLVEHRSSKDEASEDTKLDRFMQASPAAVDTESHVEQSSAQPSEPQKCEEL
jgi:hypothetical protein